MPCSCGPRGSRWHAGARRCRTCAATSRRHRARGGGRCSGQRAGATRRLPGREPLHDLGLQVRPARGGREAAQASVAGTGSPARAGTVDGVLVGPSPAATAEQREQLERLQQAIAELLPPHQRHVPRAPRGLPGVRGGARESPRPGRRRARRLTHTLGRVPRVQREAGVTWEGNVARGSGAISGATGAFSELPYSLATRIEKPSGKTSPEELLAAAHAACFAMSLASELSSAGSPPEHLDVRATVTLDQVEDGSHRIVASELLARARVTGTDRETLERLAAARVRAAR
jgi:lipoyl-dependent peroxiredoxin